MKKFSGSLTSISLDEIIKDEEKDDLKRFSTFQNEEDIFFEKSELILKFISLAIEKFEKEGEKVLSKCFQWVEKQLQRRMEYKPDLEMYDKIKLIEKNNDPVSQATLGWIKESSFVPREDNMIDALRKKIMQLTALKTMKRNTLEGKEIKIPLLRSKSLEKILLDNEVSQILCKMSEEELDFSQEDFDIFKFESKIGKKNILPIISFYVFDDSDLFDIIKSEKFIKFVYEISSGYHRENPYHNDLHAADMVQSLFLYITKADLKDVLGLLELDLATLYISAIIHDYKHPGLTNDYLINTKDELSYKYNDISVLENYHVSEAFTLIKKNPEYDPFILLSKEDFNLCRKDIIKCVLGTDMKYHSNKLAKMKNKLLSFKKSKMKSLEDYLDDSNPLVFHNTKIDFLSFIMHAADVSNPTKPLEIYKIWANRCINEFFLQGDMEKKLGLTVSFNCDRNTVKLSQSQLGFIDVIVYPLFSVLTEFFHQLNFTLDNMDKNIEYFKGIQSEDKKKEKDSKCNLKQ